MNTSQIEKCIRQDVYMRESCLGCFPSDKLPVPTKFPFGLVVNTDKSTEPGTHWLALWVDNDGNGEYFDSYGRKPPEVIERYLLRHSKKWQCVLNAPIQGHLTAVCGQHCIHFLYQRARGYPFVAVMDETVNTFVENKFALDLDVIDVPFLVNQICKAFVKNAH